MDFRGAEMQALEARDRLADKKAQIERLCDALLAIKSLVVGEARPRWDVSFETTTTRGQIADLCDRALGMTG